MKKKVVILGSTGSLGKQTIEVLENYQNYFQIIGLAAKENKTLLEEQKSIFQIPAENIVLTSRDGEDALIKLASMPEADLIVNNLAGDIGVEPTIAALCQGKQVLIANKETIVAEGEKISRLAKKLEEKTGKKHLIPLDSEHNAIFEILRKFPHKKIHKIWLPCSGGPFWHFTSEQLAKVDVAAALKHPKWTMGKKISIESATLINKGLEIIEAHYLFNQPLEKIDTFLHQACEIHGMVEFEDCFIAYYGEPDMKEHIENAFLFIKNKSKTRRIEKIKWHDFKAPSVINRNLPGIDLVVQSFQQNRVRSFLQAEQIVINKFLAGEIKFTEIYSLLHHHVTN